MGSRCVAERAQLKLRDDLEGRDAGGAQEGRVCVHQELYFAVQQKIIRHCKSMILQFNKKKENTLEKINGDSVIKETISIKQH